MRSLSGNRSRWPSRWTAFRVILAIGVSFHWSAGIEGSQGGSRTRSQGVWGRREGGPAGDQRRKGANGPAGGCVASGTGARAPRALAAVQVSRAAKPTTTRAGSHGPSRHGVLTGNRCMHDHQPSDHAPTCQQADISTYTRFTRQTIDAIRTIPKPARGMSPTESLFPANCPHSGDDRCDAVRHELRNTSYT